MQEQLKNLLIRIGLEESLFAPFENSQITDAEYDKTNHKFSIGLRINKLFDPRVYDEFINKINNGPLNIDLNIEVSDNQSQTILDEYYKYFLNIIYKDGILLDMFKGLPLEVKDNIIFISVSVSTIYDTLITLQEPLKKKFHELGIKYDLKIVNISEDESSFYNSIEKENTYVPEVKHIVEEKPIDFKSQQNKDYYTNPYAKVSISDIKDDDNRIEFEGKIFAIDIKDTRKGTRIFSIYLTDGNRSIMLRAAETKILTNELLNSLHKDQWVCVRGSMTSDNFHKDHFVSAYNIIPLDKNDDFVDDAINKRVELHLHTKMSAMDGCGNIEDYINTAAKWGHKAIAITDHGNVQAYPEAQGYAKSKNIKLIYGMEGYVVNNKWTPCYNPIDRSLKDATYVVFDLETTGLSNTFDKIIECGFVKMIDGQIVDSFQTFVNPLRKLSRKISDLTNISDDNLISAPTIDEVLPKLLKFIGDSILVAHNANFDIGFLNAALRDNGLNELTNPYIDTLDLAHCLYPHLKNFKLGSLCKELKVDYGEDDAHRADYDASVLANCLSGIIYELDNKNITNLNQLNSISLSNAYKGERPYHMTFLVKNDVGLKNLYKLVSKSYIDYITDVPNIPKDLIKEYREGLLIGSACFNGEIFETAQTRSYKDLIKLMEFYDYIEIQPLDNYKWLIETEKVDDEESLIRILKLIIKVATDSNKIIVATGDVHYLKDEDRIFRDCIVRAKSVGSRFHPLKHKLSPRTPKQHFRTTNEMIEGISYVGNIELQKKFVIDNTNLIADMIEPIYPVKDQLFTPHLHGIDADQEIRNLCNENVHKLYGENLPSIVEERMNKELDNIISNGYGVIYYLAYRLVKKSNSDGYLVGSRGSVGSSFVASLCGITEVNPLAPHYLCPSCHHSEFITDGSVRSGFDLDSKVCPCCGALMNGNGQNIPFETFLGLNGDKVPDIDLNFSRDYQANAHNYTKVLCGENNVFRAGTISTVASKTAFGYAKGYYQDNGILDFREADLRRLAEGCTDIKRTTGQHPAGIVVIPEDMDVFDFTPIQYPADEINSSWKTTHFNFKSMHDEVLKLDILGHLDPMAVKMLKDLTGIDPETIPMNDPEVLALFTGLKSLNVNSYEVLNTIGTSGVPEFGTSFVKGVLLEAKPVKFSDLVQISGLTHGNDVWNDNAASLIKNGTCTLTEVIGCRDDIMTDLTRYGMDKKDAFDTMEFVRKGKPTEFPEKWTKFVEKMRASNVPEWYIESCHKIKYMFPKAHAVAYVVMALRVAWFKVHYPIQYYAAFFSVRCVKFDIETMIKGFDTIRDKLQELRQKIQEDNNDLSNTVYDLFDTLELCLEMTARGYKFKNVSIKESDAVNFKVSEDGKSLIPPFIVIDGLGETVARKIVEERNIQEFTSKDDFQNRSGVNKTQLDTLEKLGCLDELSDSSQLSFDLGLFD